MSAPSQWPLPQNGIRFLTPAFMLNKLARHPLTRECYPTAMGFYPSAELHRMLRERHDDNLLIYCVEGCGHAAAGDWRADIGPGQVLLLPQGVAHEYEADILEPWTIYWVHFQGTGSAIFNQHLGDREGAPLVLEAGVSPQAVAHVSLAEWHRMGVERGRAETIRRVISVLPALERAAQHSSEEFQRAHGVNPQIGILPDDPVATRTVWGWHCDYADGSIDLFQTKSPAAELDRVLGLSHAPASRTPVQGLGERDRTRAPTCAVLAPCGSASAFSISVRTSVTCVGRSRASFRRQRSSR